MGGRHPIAVKLSRSAPEDLSDDEVLAAAIRQVLVDTLSAGRGLKTLLSRSPREIWTYPMLVNEALVRRGCLPESTPGVVVRERLADEALLESVVHTASAVTGMLSLATAALGVAAPPVLVAVFVADLVASLADALLVYYRYYQQKLAFDAVLSPDLSIAAEPGLLWAAFLIGLDLLAFLPPRPHVR